MVHTEFVVPMRASVFLARRLAADSTETALLSKHLVVVIQRDAIAVLEVSAPIFFGASTAFALGPAPLSIVCVAKATCLRGLPAAIDRTYGPFPLPVVPDAQMRGVWMLSMVGVAGLTASTFSGL
jgi:hypothetical protein